MRTRFLFAAIFIFTLPMWFSQVAGKTTLNSAPFATVVNAGHSIVGNGVWCECGSGLDCACDPGETPHSRRDNYSQPSATSDDALSDAKAANGFDLGAGVMLLTLALLFGLRMRS